MDQEALVKERLEAGEEFAREFNTHYPVAVAFWFFPAESERWYFYLASPEITDGKRRLAYRAVSECGALLRSPWLESGDVRILSATDPLSAAIIAVRDQYNLKAPTPFDRPYVGGLVNNGVYINPPITTPAKVSKPRDRRAGRDGVAPVSGSRPRKQKSPQ